MNRRHARPGPRRSTDEDQDSRPRNRHPRSRCNGRLRSYPCRRRGLLPALQVVFQSLAFRPDQVPQGKGRPGPATWSPFMLTPPPRSRPMPAPMARRSLKPCMPRPVTTKPTSRGARVFKPPRGELVTERNGVNWPFLACFSRLASSPTPLSTRPLTLHPCQLPASAGFHLSLSKHRRWVDSRRAVRG